MNNFLLQHAYDNDNFYAVNINQYDDKTDEFYAQKIEFQEALFEMLSEDGKELFREYLDACMLFDATCKKNAYISGVKTGAKLAHELFVQE